MGRGAIAVPGKESDQPAPHHLLLSAVDGVIAADLKGGIFCGST
jgi:hypothetical protein